MSDNKGTKKNTIAIIIVTAVIILIVGGILLSKPISKLFSGNDNEENTSPTVQSISVVQESGDVDATIEADIALRDIEFGKTIKQVKKMESKLDDTLDDPSSASSNDGYTYLTYSFNKDATPTFFGTAVSTTSAEAILVYVFYNDSLIEVRVQYGAIGTTGYDTVVANCNSEYGNASYSRSYSNGAKQTWWKTADVKLDVIYQNDSVVAYYSTTSK